MRLTDKQRRILIALQHWPDGKHPPVAGQLCFVGGFSEYAVLDAMKRLERRCLAERVPGTFTIGHPYGAWSTRWRLTDAGRGALS